ncbi:hypothetical protein HON22_00035 [Candidatus Peregrinibacteria bacterium]|nr:hypothetical protein [Candidatus Peregrinibacteria bacterium]
MEKLSAPLSVFPTYNLLTKRYDEFDSFQFDHFNEVIQVYNYVRKHPDEIRDEDTHATVLGQLRRYLRLWLPSGVANHVGVNSYLTKEIDKNKLEIERLLSFNKWITPYLDRFHDKIIPSKSPYPEEDFGLVFNA